MYYQQEDDNNKNDEEESKNEYSEELMLLTEKSNLPKNEIQKLKYINDKYLQRETLNYNSDNVTDEFYRNTSMNEKIEKPNIMMENKNKTIKSKEKAFYNYNNYERKYDNTNAPLRYYFSKSHDDYSKNYVYNPNIMANNEKNIEKTKREYKYGINDIISNANGKDFNKKDKNSHYLNFSYDEERIIGKPIYNINYNENINLNNNSLIDNKNSDDDNNEKYINNDNNYYNKNSNIINTVTIKLNDDYKNTINEKIYPFPMENKESIDTINYENKIKNNQIIKVNKTYSSNKSLNYNKDGIKDIYSQIIKRNNETNIDEEGENFNDKNFYYFCYDTSAKIRNYHKKTEKTGYSTEQSTNDIKTKGYKNSNVKEFQINENDIKPSNIQTYGKNGSNIETNNMNEKIDNNNNFIDIYYNLENREEKKEKKDYDKNNNNKYEKNINNDDYKNINKINYIDDIKNVNIYKNYEENKTKNIIENSNNTSTDNNNLEENEQNISSNNINNILNNNYNFGQNKGEIMNYGSNFSTIKYNENLNNIIDELDDGGGHKEQDNKTINEENKESTTTIQESMNFNTIESNSITKIKDEEEKRAIEIEEETKRLNELENQKIQLILEEKERRQRIIEEIEKQEKNEKENLIIIKKQYEERLRKKKEDEEKLKKIKIEQEKKLKEINELIYQAEIDEQKLLLLTEGKLNRRQRKNYRNSFKNDEYNSKNKIPFDINNKEENKYGDNEDILIKMKNYCIDKDSRLWSFKKKENKTNDNNIIGLRKINYINKKPSYNNQEFSVSHNYKNYNSNDDDIIINDSKEDSTKNKNEKITFNLTSRPNECMSLSNKIGNYKKNNFHLSATEHMDINNKLGTDLPERFSFSVYNNGQYIYDNSSRNSKLNIKDKKLTKTSVEEKTKGLYQKKVKTHNKVINIKMPKNKNINNSSDKKEEEKNKVKLREKSYDDKININEPSSKLSYKELKEIKAITSKMASDIEKKIELIDKSQNIMKAKSAPKFNPYIKFIHSESYPNKENNNNMKNNKCINDKINKSKKENSKINKNSKSFKDVSNVKKEEKKISKQKSYMENYVLPSDIKKECLLELSRLKKEKNGKKKNENMQTNFGNSATFRENRYSNRKTLENLKKSKNKFKKGKVLNALKKDNTENKNYNVGNQKTYYKDFLYGPEKNNHSSNFLNEVFSSENTSKLFPYIKDLY